MKRIIVKISLLFGITILSFLLGCSEKIISPEANSDNLNKITEAVPSPVTINLELFFTGANTAAGTFNISGIVNDNGTVAQEFTLNGQPNNPGTAHGRKTLTGQDGEFDIRFQVRITPASPTTAVAEGRFVIMNGTGNYQGFHGVGTTYIEIDFVAGTLTGTYEGQAQFDNRN